MSKQEKQLIQSRCSKNINVHDGGKAQWPVECLAFRFCFSTAGKFTGYIQLI